MDTCIYICIDTFIYIGGTEERVFVYYICIDTCLYICIHTFMYIGGTKDRVFVCDIFIDTCLYVCIHIFMYIDGTKDNRFHWVVQSSGLVASFKFQLSCLCCRV